MKLKPQFRSIRLDRRAIDIENRTVPLSFSSETPCERWWGIEILDHSPGSLRLDRLKAGGPLLVDHDPCCQIGVVEEISIGTDRTGRALVRFGKGQRAEEEWQDVIDGIRQNVSVGYRVHEMALESKTDTVETYRVTDWEPLEISMVSIPADITVGAGRAAEQGEEQDVTVKDISPEDVTCPECGGEGCPACMVEETDPETEGENGCKPKQKTEQEIKAMSIEITEQTRKEELDRVRQIQAIGSQHEARDLADKHIAEGSSVDEMRAAVLERMGKIKPVTTSAEIGLSKKEQRNYSILRAINALANPGDRKAQDAAAFEFECSRAVSENIRKAPQGFFLPMDVQQRDLTVGTAADGGNLKATNLLAGSFIDALRNKMMVKQMGAQVLDGLVGDIAIPKQTGAATAYWVAENSAPTEGALTFGQVTMAPKTVGAYVDLSRKLILQSTPSAEMLVENDLTSIIALAIDAAALHGTGSNNQPTGIAATSGIGSVAGGTNGLAPTWANMISLWSEVAIDNAEFGTTGFLTNAKVIGKLMSTQKVATYGNDFVINSFPDQNGFTNIGGARCGVSNQVSSALTKGSSSGVCSAIFFGSWSQLLLGYWGASDILVDPYTGSAAGTVRVRVLQDADVAVRYAQAFSAMLDALTT